jgi:predicted ArsR family transcriptional regulator
MDNSTITQFERVKVSMEAVVPIIRDFESAFGKEAVHRVLEARVERKIEEARSSEAYKLIEPDFEKAEKGIEFYSEGGALRYEVIACDKDSLQFNVTDCQYAKMMKGLNATDLGHLLVCQGDFAGAYRSGMELKRTQTRMQGYSHCDFRYHRR